MNKIVLLDDKLINKISAGEVIERPASIVKELIENSIDAGSKNITIEIMDGGIPYIKITDDGCGMDDIDAILAFERHATSKIKSDNDLYNINTLGFRGEALASIAAISYVSLQTREEKSLFGTKVVVEGGKVLEKSACGCPKGCIVEVKNVFYNTPARRKFLKRPSTEAMYITDIVSKLCLSHPEISFKYIKDKKIEFLTSGNGDIKDVILRLYGSDVYSSLINSTYESEYLKLNVFAGNTTLTRSNRNMQIFYVNGRYIKNKVLSAAVDEVFKTLIPVNRYPVVFLYMTIDPRQVDVNIHPTKLEIKFSDERGIFDIVYSTIKNSLNNYKLIPDIKLNNKNSVFKFNKENVKQEQRKLDIVINKNNTLSSNMEDNIDKNIYFGKTSLIDKADKVFEGNSLKNTLTDVQNDADFNFRTDTLNTELFDFKIVGTLFSTYIIVEKEDVFYIIDQHAAHERILYEKFRAQYESRIAAKQTTMPIIVNIQPGDIEILNQEISFLNKLGYKFEQFGNNSVVLREVPIILGQPEAKQLFIDIIEELKNKDLISKINLKEEKIIMMACKAAVKAMDKLSEEEIRKLFNDLKIVDNPFTCPHGRPVIVSITKTQLEKMFKRIM